MACWLWKDINEIPFDLRKLPAGARYKETVISKVGQAKAVVSWNSKRKQGIRQGQNPRTQQWEQADMGMVAQSVSLISEGANRGNWKCEYEGLWSLDIREDVCLYPLKNL